MDARDTRRFASSTPRRARPGRSAAAPAAGRVHARSTWTATATSTCSTARPAGVCAAAQRRRALRRRPRRRWPASPRGRRRRRRRRLRQRRRARSGRAAQRGRHACYRNDASGASSTSPRPPALSLRARRRAPRRSSTSTTTATSTSLLAGDGDAAACCATTATARFTDVTAAAGLRRRRRASSRSCRPTSTTGRDIDLLELAGDRPPRLFRNMRDGTFRDVAAEAAGLPAGCALPQRVGRRRQQGRLHRLLPRRRGRARRAGAQRRHAAASRPRRARSARRAPRRRSSSTTTTTACSTSWRSRAGGARARRATSAAAGPTSTAAAPGETRAARLRERVAGRRRPRRRRRHGPGARARRGRAARAGATRAASASGSVRVRLAGRVSNRSGVGAKVEMRAGSLRQKLETYAATPAGARRRRLRPRRARGRRRRARALALGHPADRARDAGRAARRAFQRPGAGPQAVVVPLPLRLERPALRVRHRLHGRRRDGLLGSRPASATIPIPIEYVRLDDDQLRPRDGRYELRVTNELEEALFVDRLALVAVDHPADVEVYPLRGHDRAADGRTRSSRSKSRGRSPARPTTTATTCLDRIARLDRVYPDDFRTQPHPRLRRAARPDARPGRPRRDARRCCSSRAGPTTPSRATTSPPHKPASRCSRRALEVEAATGRWVTAVEQVGIPVGRPQTVVVPT